jgi:hypothetical protein
MRIAPSYEASVGFSGDLGAVLHRPVGAGTGSVMFGSAPGTPGPAATARQIAQERSSAQGLLRRFCAHIGPTLAALVCAYLMAPVAERWPAQELAVRVLHLIGG